MNEYASVFVNPVGVILVCLGLLIKQTNKQTIFKLDKCFYFGSFECFRLYLVIAIKYDATITKTIMQLAIS